MGDRRQVKFSPCNIWFYTHWDGRTLAESLQQGIQKATPRWDDEPYSIRIILGHLLSPYEDKETGAGIWHTFQDTDYRSRDFDVDIERQTVALGNDTWTFHAFSTLEKGVIDIL